ncbi:MAG: TVP38/TMEM64 family protein [Candidatus Omnitrophica bacterium]|nr:TVP38/TMEM64 family protein [Candidatus Omnitrophota bacterium]
MKKELEDGEILMNHLLENKIFKWVLFVVLIVVPIFFGLVFHFDFAGYQRYFQQLPPVLTGIVYVFLYVLTTTLIWLGPRDIFRVGGAILFGPYLSTIFVSVAEIINCGIMFYLSRALGQDIIGVKFRIKEKDLQPTRKRTGFLGSLALRLNPLVPFRFQDIGAGLSTISFRRYFLAILIASPIRIFWFQYIVAGIGEGFLHNPSAAINYFVQKPFIVVYSCFYFLAILILSILAIALRVRSNKK